MSADALDILRSIDATLKELVALQRVARPKPVASDRDLDGAHGDPVVKFNPRDWAGPSFKGCNLSQCPAEFLDLLAGAFDYFGDQAEKNGELTGTGKPVANYKRADAARARGWAKRNRENWKPPAFVGSAPAAAAGEWEASSAQGWGNGGAGFEAPAGDGMLTDDDIPF